jgi:hypothetical protein
MLQRPSQHACTRAVLVSGVSDAEGNINESIRSGAGRRMAPLSSPSAPRDSSQNKQSWSTHARIVSRTARCSSGPCAVCHVPCVITVSALVLGRCSSGPCAVCHVPSLCLLWYWGGAPVVHVPCAMCHHCVCSGTGEVLQWSMCHVPSLCLLWYWGVAPVVHVPCAARYHAIMEGAFTARSVPRLN